MHSMLYYFAQSVIIIQLSTGSKVIVKSSKKCNHTHFVRRKPAVTGFCREETKVENKLTKLIFPARSQAVLYKMSIIVSHSCLGRLVFKYFTSR